MEAENQTTTKSESQQTGKVSFKKSLAAIEELHKSGFIGDEEFQKRKSELTAQQEVSKARKAFDQFDADKSGKIDVSEFRDLALQLGEMMTDHELMEVVKKIDSDGSGDIDFDEFLVWWRGQSSAEGEGRDTFIKMKLKSAHYKNKLKNSTNAFRSNAAKRAQKTTTEEEEEEGFIVTNININVGKIVNESHKLEFVYSKSGKAEALKENLYAEEEDAFVLQFSVVDDIDLDSWKELASTLSSEILKEEDIPFDAIDVNVTEKDGEKLFSVVCKLKSDMAAMANGLLSSITLEQLVFGAHFDNDNAAMNVNLSAKISDNIMELVGEMGAEKKHVNMMELYLGADLTLRLKSIESLLKVDAVQSTLSENFGEDEVAKMTGPTALLKGVLAVGKKEGVFEEAIIASIFTKFTSSFTNVKRAFVTLGEHCFCMEIVFPNFISILKEVELPEPEKVEERDLSEFNESVTYTKQHPCVLTLTKSAYGGFGYGCDVCGRSGLGPCYHCDDCQFDVHLDCVPKKHAIKGFKKEEKKVAVETTTETTTIEATPETTAQPFVVNGRRFRKGALADPENEVLNDEEFKKNFHDVFVASPDMSIVHMNDIYWKYLPSSACTSGKVAFLRSVCWGEFTAEVKAPEGDDWDVVMRMSLSKPDLFNTNPGVLKCTEGGTFEFAFKTTNMTQNWVEEGFFIQNMGPIAFDEGERGEVTFNFRGDISSWWGGFCVDWIGFVKKGTFPYCHECPDEPLLSEPDSYTGSYSDSDYDSDSDY